MCDPHPRRGSKRQTWGGGGQDTLRLHLERRCSIATKNLSPSGVPEKKKGGGYGVVNQPKDVPADTVSIKGEDRPASKKRAPMDALRKGTKNSGENRLSQSYTTINWWGGVLLKVLCVCFGVVKKRGVGVGVVSQVSAEKENSQGERGK